ncbi:hypothetical protein EV426DRAFT_701734 [Tirmania nivea]|nr:hypothetical protein EV426DRAFT_701734 [Tirmania nivea]
MASRRPNPGAEKAAANQQVIKNLLKLPGNKYCADCKRNKLPRWASWNLGIFICIRCSGVHRGMGTHISRVKSVDLDSWTDEQLASMVKWGNTRANKYWEANLAAGHIPSEAKIENFIRTKYESKRWVMDGPMPDPATLSDDEDGETIDSNSTFSALPPRAASAPPKKSDVSLFDDGPDSEKTSQPGGLRSQISSKGEPAPPKSSKPGDSLLGLDDFFGPSQQAAPRSDSVNSNAVPKPNRPDLKTSILSLYSSAQQPVKTQGHQSTPSFGNSASQMQHSAFGDLNDAFSGLNFSSPQPHAPQPQKPNAFANLTSANLTSALTRSPPVAPQVTPAQSGGFFGTPAAKKHTKNTSTAASSGLNDLFALPSPPQQQPTLGSTTATTAKPALTANFAAFDNAWSSPSPAAPVHTQAVVWGASNNSIASNAFAGLGTSHLSSGKRDDDEFGAFTGVGAAGSPSGLGASAVKVDDDPFANVWK